MHCPVSLVQPVPGISVQHAPLTAEGVLVAAGYMGIMGDQDGWAWHLTRCSMHPGELVV